jgi:hypothetical protein
MAIGAAFGDGAAVKLSYRYPLDGRPSSHPLDARGFTTMNCYLLLESDGALLYSTGYSIHQQELLSDLEQLVEDRPLSIVVPRVEYSSMCNARPVADRFHVTAAYLRLPTTASALLNFRPDIPLEGDGLSAVETYSANPGQRAPIGSGGRELTFFLPELRLLPCVWAYDPGTGTLFTGDLFSWVRSSDANVPEELDAAGGDPTTVDDVAHFLLRNRYWWLAGAETQDLRGDVNRMFERLDVAVVAPDHGPILRGDAIGRHRAMLDEVLTDAAQRPFVGVEAGRWPAVVGR